MRMLPCVLVVVAGCASPLSPSRPAPVPLTVRVLTQDTHTPISGAAIWLDARCVSATDESGTAILTMPAHATPHIWATAEGYQDSVPYSDVLTSDHERWTFYLWR